MKNYVLLFVCLLSLNICISQTIRVKKGKTLEWNASFPTALDSLILEDNSTLLLRTNVENLVIGEFIIGKKVRIIGIGKNGKNGKSYKGRKPRRKHGHGKGPDGNSGGDGIEGDNGYNFIVKTNNLIFGSVVINTSGGNGGKGGNAQGGGKGTNASCNGHNGGAGGNGGKGGNGGRGGDAGRVKLTFNKMIPMEGSQISRDVVWEGEGGRGGNGGKGASGGSGGNSVKCNIFLKIRGGNGGKKGKDGRKGSNGRSYNTSQKEWLDYH